MRNITNNFSEVYVPYKALLIYQSETDREGHEDKEVNTYVESYDIGKHGNPVNAHPLTLKESVALADLLQASRELQNGFLKSKGVLPSNLLYLNSQRTGYAVWHTPTEQRKLYFTENLGIKSGLTYLPGLVWLATRDQLYVYAIKGNRKPNANTKLYHPPFFNIHGNGQVCMGNVRIQIDHNTCLEDFMEKWQRYFYESYFSHSLAGGSVVNGNIVQLWQQQLETGQKFPETCLIKNGKTIQNLIQ
jgi:PRTRC genetic system protein B